MATNRSTPEKPSRLPNGAEPPEHAVPAHANRDETRLVSRLRANDPAAYEQLVRTYAGRMLSVALRFLRNPDDARDCVQDAFLDAFRAIGRFEGRASLGTWLHRIVVNTALTKIRARERRAEDSLDDLLPTYDASGRRVEPETGRSSSLETHLERRETRDLVRSCIDRLPEHHRAILIVRDIHGYDTKEAALLLGLETGTVKTRLHRARAALKTMIEPLLRGDA